MHGKAKQVTLNLSATAYGCGVDLGDKKRTVDLAQEERTETTQNTLTVTAPPHTHTVVYQLVLHCKVRSGEKLLPFDVATRDTKVVLYRKGVQRIEPSQERPSQREVKRWSGMVICDKCQQRTHPLRSDEGSCVHQEEWHQRLGDCNLMRCAYRLGGSNIGR